MLRWRYRRKWFGLRWTTLAFIRDRISLSASLKRVKIIELLNPCKRFDWFIKRISKLLREWVCELLLSLHQVDEVSFLW
jgi:hypothetical protein